MLKNINSLISSDMRRGTPISLLMSHHASVSKKVIMSSLANAGKFWVDMPFVLYDLGITGKTISDCMWFIIGRCQRRWGLMCWRWSQRVHLPLERRHSLECESTEILVLISILECFNVLLDDPFCWRIWLSQTKYKFTHFCWLTLLHSTLEIWCLTKSTLTVYFLG